MTDIETWNKGLYNPLKKTIDYAKQNIPYYSDKIKTITGKTINELLNCIPLLDKETAIDNLQELRKDFISQPGRISTGTLRKNRRFMDVQYTLAEDRAIQLFYQNNYSWTDAYNFASFDNLAIGVTKQQNEPFIIRIINTHYEIPKYTNEANTISFLWTAHANSFEIIKESLLKFKQINFLDVEATTLIKLTLMLDKHQFNFQEIKINTIMLHGYLSAKWLHFLLAKWNCYISEDFSLSEMRAKAYLCTNQSIPHFHFEPLPIVTEVLHPLTKESINLGAGLLCLTPLYPFTQQQLLLRYLTQDIVSIVPCNQKSTLGFRWCGRDRDVVFLDKQNSHSSVGLREIIECLDNYYEIARSTDDFETLGLIETGSVGWPLFKIELIDNVKPLLLKIHVILIYPPQIFPEKTTDLCNNITIDILQANEYLYKRFSTNQLNIQIVPYPPSKQTDLDGWHINQFQKIIKNK